MKKRFVRGYTVTVLHGGTKTAEGYENYCGEIVEVFHSKKLAIDFAEKISLSEKMHTVEVEQVRNFTIPFDGKEKFTELVYTRTYATEVKR